MTLREGPQAPDVQRLGHITSSMANAVCQGYPKAPGEDPVLYLFSSLPSGWNAHIRVNTEHGYLAEAVAEDGICSWIRPIGSTDKMVLRNPWGERQVKDRLRADRGNTAGKISHDKRQLQDMRCIKRQEK